MKTFITTLILTLTFTMNAHGQNDDESFNEAAFNVAMTLLDQEAVVSHLEMTDDQVEELKALRKKINLLSLDFATETGVVGEKQAQENYFKKLEVLRSQFSEILLPHQVEAISILGNNFRYGATIKNSFGVLNRLTKQKLGITEDQAKKIKSKSKTLQEEYEAKQKEFEEKLAQMRKEHRKEIMKELTDEQRAKFEKLFGEIDLTSIIKRN